MTLPLTLLFLPSPLLNYLGSPNATLIQENHKLAFLFKGKSVAEQNSIVLAWDTLMESRFDELRKCIYSTPYELNRFRQLLANTVLATDIFDKDLQTLRKQRWNKAFDIANKQEQQPDIRDHQQEHSISAEDEVNRKATIVIEHLIQASDVAHTMQHWHVYKKWNERLFAEMTVAYQAGRSAKNPADGWYEGEFSKRRFLDLMVWVVYIFRTMPL
jgi:hypothetical protein